MKKLNKKKFHMGRGVMTGLLLLMLMLASTWVLPGADIAHAAGSGTVADPIQISTIQELKNMSKGLDKHYILLNDIEFPDGYYWIAVGTTGAPFRGSLNGNGFKIKNLLIDVFTDYTGLFGAISGANIKNLTLENVNVIGKSYVGAITGQANQSSRIENCAVAGEVSGIGHMGGLVGNMIDSYILKSKNAANITSREDNIGGIAGYINGSSTIEECYNTGTIKGGQYLGGIVGRSTGTSSKKGIIRNIFNRGNVGGDWNYTAGLVGYASYTVIEYGYSTGEISADYGANGIVGYSNYSTVQYTASMCEKISASDVTYRIGRHANSIFNNLAYEDMVVLKNGIVQDVRYTNPLPSHEHGYNVPKQRIISGNYLESLSWDFTDIWEQADGDYPVLKNVSSAPSAR